VSNNRNSLIVFFVILIVNAAGFLLRYFQLDTYFILIGFRFHLSLLIPFLIVLKYIDFTFVRELIIHPSKQRFILILILSFLPLLFIPFDMFLLKEFKVGEQDYFFELGLSSITDYPIYLLWNTPQIFTFFIFMNTVLKTPKYKFVKAFLVIFFLFIYEIIPIEIIVKVSTFNFQKINYIPFISFFFISLLGGLFISRIKNIYLFTLVLFTVLWGSILSFGSSSETLVNMLLASQYESWTGFITAGRKQEYVKYFQPAYLFIIIIFSFIVLKKTK
jgi:hypothetical protein